MEQEAVRYKMTIEYDGSHFCGMQRQIEQVSAQGEIESILELIFKQKIEIGYAGRTDSGVHANGQVIHFDIPKEKAVRFPKGKLSDAMNFHLKDRRKAISILSEEIVSNEFHARFSAKMRQYKYLILNRRNHSAFHDRRMWHVARPLNIEAMQKASSHLIGEHDFSSFCATEVVTREMSTMRTIEEITIIKSGDEITITISAKSFLYNMVRIIVGTLVDVGHGKISPESIQDILSAKSRKSSSDTAPAWGLYFDKVEY